MSWCCFKKPPCELSFNSLIYLTRQSFYRNFSVALFLQFKKNICVSVNGKQSTSNAAFCTGAMCNLVNLTTMLSLNILSLPFKPVSKTCKATCERTQQCWTNWPTLLPPFAKSLTGFKLCAATCNRVCKRTQHVKSNNVGSCWSPIFYVLLHVA